MKNFLALCSVSVSLSVVSIFVVSVTVVSGSKKIVLNPGYFRRGRVQHGGGGAAMDQRQDRDRHQVPAEPSQAGREEGQAEVRAVFYNQWM